MGIMIPALSKANLRRKRYSRATLAFSKNLVIIHNFARIVRSPKENEFLGYMLYHELVNDLKA